FVFENGTNRASNAGLIIDGQDSRSSARRPKPFHSDERMAHLLRPIRRKDSAERFKTLPKHNRRAAPWNGDVEGPSERAAAGNESTTPPTRGDAPYRRRGRRRLSR